MMKHQISYAAITIIIIIFLSACNLPTASSNLNVEDRVATSLQQTNDAEASETEAVETVDESAAAATLTPVPGEKATATMTLTPMLEVPLISVSVDTNCRNGPGTVYNWIGALLVGEEAEVVGQSEDGQYWIIENPNQAGTCWLWGNYASVTGSTDALPQYTPPPTPTPTSTPTPAFDWEGTWTTYAVSTGGTETFTLTVTVNGKNFTGVVDTGGGSTVNMSGTISNDYLSVSGTWGPSNYGTFEFFASGTNQFQGNGNNTSETFGWCGSRSGAGQPSPCFMD